MAEALRARGWRVHWLGVPGSMEERLVPPRGFALRAGRVRRRARQGTQDAAGLAAAARARARPGARVIRRVQPDVVLGLGGYITVPGGLAARLAGVPILLHEQNSIAGMSNRWLAKLAERSFSAYPDALPGGEWVGNRCAPSS